MDPPYCHPAGATPVRKISSLPAISEMRTEPGAHVTAIAALVASLTSRKLSLLFLTAFGFYYALDAIFFLTYGFFNDKPYGADILLNLPHVLISTVMLGVVYWFAPKVEPRPA
jgi:hypothetical protein